MIGLVGASGFLGQTFRDYMNECGVPVVCFSRVEGNTRALALTGKGINESRYLDLLQKNFSTSSFEGVSTVVLMSSATKPNTAGNSNANEMACNVEPHRAFLAYLSDFTDVRRIIFLSSGGAVYGNTTGVEAIREDAQLDPVTPYGWGKLKIEEHLCSHWVGPDRVGHIVRPANPVGVYQLASKGAHGLMTTVCYKILRDEVVTVMGTGKTIRDYFAATDLAEFVRLLCIDERKESRILNCGSGKGISISGVIDLCERQIGKKAIRNYILNEDDKVSRNVLNTSEAQAFVNWLPKKTIDQVASELVKHIEQDGR